MPRSNKKKKTFHPVVPVSDIAIKDLLNMEKFTMIARAIVSSLFIECLLSLYLIIIGKCTKTWNPPATWDN